MTGGFDPTENERIQKKKEKLKIYSICLLVFSYIHNLKCSTFNINLVLHEFFTWMLKRHTVLLLFIKLNHPGVLTNHFWHAVVKIPWRHGTKLCFYSFVHCSWFSGSQLLDNYLTPPHHLPSQGTALSRSVFQLCATHFWDTRHAAWYAEIKKKWIILLRFGFVISQNPKFEHFTVIRPRQP